MSGKRGEYREIRNILSQGPLSKASLTLFLEIVSTLFRRVISRFGHFHLRYYPDNIRRLSLNIRAVKFETVSCQSLNIVNGPKRLELAYGYLDFDTIPNWRESFDDQEQFFSLHRWNWLLFASTSCPDSVDLDWGKTLIRSWLLEMSPLPAGEASESYSVGERISNTCLFFRHQTGGWNNIPDDILSAIQLMAAHLSQRVEYYPNNLSGNHVFNNSRAILFAGHCCHDESLTLLGRAILQDQLPKLIDKYGFLREGSSHYQLLVTRWVLEIRMMAIEFEDLELLSAIQPLVPKMLSACDFFFVNGANGTINIPMIGDVSPDCLPEWLLGLLDSPLSGLRGRSENPKGWASLFPDFSSDYIFDLPKPSSFSDSNWGRVDFQGWTAIWHLEESSGHAIASHAHHDFSSLVLFLNGEEILIDPGRYSYKNDEMSRYGTEACAHNTIQLNEFPPMLSKGDRILPEVYRQSSCSAALLESADNLIVKIKHDGFSRLSKSQISHVRQFVFTKTSCEISDHIDGDGHYFIESFFQWPFKMENNTLSECFEVLGIRFHVEKYGDNINMECNTASTDPVYGWRFPSYLDKSPCTTQRFFGNVELPLKLSYKIVKR